MSFHLLPSPRPRSRQRQLAASACLAAALGLLLVSSAHAAARTETLTWSHPSPSEVAGFEVLVGASSRSYDEILDAGLPAQNADGDYEYAIEVLQDVDVYVAVRAYAADGTRSPLSNERVRPASTTSDGGTSDGGTGDGGTSDGGTSDGGTGSGDLPEGALYAEDFEGHATGTAVASWRDTGAYHSMIEDDSLFSVVAVPSGQALTTASTQSAIHSHYVDSAAGGWAAYEVSGRMGGTDSTSRLGVTAYSRYPTGEDAYYAISTHWQTGEFEIFRRPSPDASYQCPDGRGTGTVMSPSQWYRFRLQVEPVASGTELRAKVWPEGQTEPSSWGAVCTDTRSARPASGSIGVWSGRDGSKYWDDLVVMPLSEQTSTSPSEPEPEPLGAPGQPVLLP